MKYGIFVGTWLLAAAAAAQVATPPSAGSGTAGDPYCIGSLSNLYWISQSAARYTNYYLQTNHIDASETTNWFSGAGWTPIGGNNTTNMFAGNYDGNGFVVSNLYIHRSSSSNIGLFGHLGRGGVVAYLGVHNANVTGARGVGCLAGRVTGDSLTFIRCCHASGSVSGGGASGGLVGSNNSYVENPGNADNHPTIEKCWANVAVTWSKTGNGDKLGALAGCNQKGKVFNSYALGSVTIDNSGGQVNPGPERVGGLVGCILLRGVASNSYSTGPVATIGTVTNVGGCIGNGGSGSGADGTSIGCFWDINTSGRSTSSPTSGCTGTNTASMKTQATFTNAGWDYSATWSLNAAINSGYPYLNANSPTPVVLYRFTAGAENGQVVVRWQTASEEDTVGFYVERLDNTGWTRINAALTPASGVDGLGAAYGIMDEGAVPDGTYTYRLIEVETGGEQTYGPFVRTASELVFRGPLTINERGELTIRWLSREGESYRILRSVNPAAGPDGYDVVASGIAATLPENICSLPRENLPAAFFIIQVENE